MSLLKKGGDTMEITLTAKLKILPSEEQQELFLKTMRAWKDACNYVSAHIVRTHILNNKTLHDDLYRELRARFGLPSQMAQSVLRTVIAKYKTILTNQKAWIQPMFKIPEVDLVWNRDYSLTKGVFSVNTLEGRAKVAFLTTGMKNYMDGSWRFGTAKLKTKHGKWFLHIAVTKDIPNLDIATTPNVVGVDLGINFLAVSYDSNGKTTFYSGRAVKQKRAQYKKTRKDLQKRQTPSARRRLKKIGEREHRWMQDVNHCVSKALVTTAPTGTLFVLEDLTGIRQATERVALKHRYEQVSWAFYDLRFKIEYKAQKNGCWSITVDPRRTSQTCPVCGHTELSNRNKNTHSFTCRICGYRSNDDRIGAMNLHNKGIEYLLAVAAA